MHGPRGEKTCLLGLRTVSAQSDQRLCYMLIGKVSYQSMSRLTMKTSFLVVGSSDVYIGEELKRLSDDQF